MLALNYAIKGASPNDYVMLERCLVPERDWRGLHYLEVWIQNDDIPKQAIIQFGEQRRCAGEDFKGEVWRTFVDLAPGQTGTIKLSLSDFEWADWSPSENRQLDLNAIGYFALGIQGSGLGSGSVYFGTAQLLP